MSRFDFPAKKWEQKWSDGIFSLYFSEFHLYLPKMYRGSHMHLDRSQEAFWCILGHPTVYCLVFIHSNPITQIYLKMQKIYFLKMCFPFFYLYPQISNNKGGTGFKIRYSYTKSASFFCINLNKGNMNQYKWEGHPNTLSNKTRYTIYS